VDNQPPSYPEATQGVRSLHATVWAPTVARGHLVNEEVAVRRTGEAAVLTDCVAWTRSWGGSAVGRSSKRIAHVAGTEVVHTHASPATGRAYSSRICLPPRG